MRSCLGACLVLLGLGLFNPTPVQALEYTIKYGDTLPKLAKRFYGDSKQWRRIADANGLETGDFFKVGDVILIPEDGDPDNPGAHIERFRGEVAMLLPPDGEPKAASRGAALLWQYGVRTGKDAGAALKLPDGALVQMASATELVVLGARGKGKRDKVVRIQLKRGSVELFGAKGQSSRLEVLTGDGLAKLMGSSLRFGVEGGLYRVATPDGTIMFDDLAVEAGQGGLVHPVRGRSLEPLPEAPRLALPKQNAAAVLVSFGRDERPSLRWSPVPGALRYEAMVTAADRKEDALKQYTMDGETTSLRLPLDRPGVFEVRLRAIDKEGLPGPWARSTLWHLVLTPTNRYTGQTADGKASFVGAGELVFNPTSQDMLLYASIDGAPMTLVGVRETITVRGVGEHTLTLRVKPGAILDQNTPLPDTTVPITVTSITRIEVEFAPLQLDPLQVQEVNVKIKLRDRQGRPVVGEQPMVEAGRRSCQAKPTEVLGEYACSLRPRVKPGLETLPLLIKGRGGTFVHREQFTVTVPEQDKLKLRRRK
ncbi:MAG: FecR domain-containing protein [Myxococcota bacterium]